MTKIPGIYRTAHRPGLRAFALVLVLACFPPFLDSPAYAQVCTEWKDAVRVGELQPQLNEASGLAASRKFPGRLYHLNDSGDTGRFYITDSDGKNTQAVAVEGFQPQDTEALGLGPCPGSAAGSCLFLGDIGDNQANRKSIEIAVVDEVQTFGKSVKPRKRFSLRYPDGPHDAESMAVHPDGTLYILTKEAPARLFKTDPRAAPPVLTQVTTLDPGGKATDMAISDDGTRVLVLTYTEAVEYSMDFKRKQGIAIAFLQQQESVAYLPGSRSFIYTSERLLPMLPQYIMRVDCGQP